MAWIESHQALERHPKVFKLMRLMNWDLDTTLGKLHRFWWWCLDYAEDGDLRTHGEEVGMNVGLTDEEAPHFLQALVAARWVDPQPYLRVHDWWDRIGPYLRAKYRKSPTKWQNVRALYVPCTGDCMDSDTYLPTYLPTNLQGHVRTSPVDNVETVDNSGRTLKSAEDEGRFAHGTDGEGEGALTALVARIAAWHMRPIFRTRTAPAEVVRQLTRTVHAYGVPAITTLFEAVGRRGDAHPKVFWDGVKTLKPPATVGHAK